MEIKIINTIAGLRKALPLFEGYRQFYNQEPNPEMAEAFLLQHHNNKTHIFIGAFEDDQIIGFTQLYPSFSSVSLEKMFILNDLFVDPDFRSKGVGKALINFAQLLAINNNWKGLVLETGIHNPAQKLYERTGWTKDLDYYHYSWSTKSDR